MGYIVHKILQDKAPKAWREGGVRIGYATIVIPTIKKSITTRITLSSGIL
jgi:hypothetical protein